MASIAATGFGLTALCIADQRGYLPHAQIVERVRTTLDWHLNKMPEVHGFFYHFTDIETGARSRSGAFFDRHSLLLCGVLTARAYFDDPEIQVAGTTDLRARGLAVDAERRRDVLHGLAARNRLPRSALERTIAS